MYWWSFLWPAVTLQAANHLRYLNITPRNRDTHTANITAAAEPNGSLPNIATPTLCDSPTSSALQRNVGQKTDVGHASSHVTTATTAPSRHTFVSADWLFSPDGADPESSVILDTHVHECAALYSSWMWHVFKRIFEKKVLPRAPAVQPAAALSLNDAAVGQSSAGDDRPGGVSVYPAPSPCLRAHHSYREKQKTTKPKE